MAIKDSLVSWYVKRMLMPGQQAFENPGFLAVNFDEHHYARQTLIPEEVIAEIERRGREDGLDEQMYKIGKKFGYRVADINHLPRKSNSSTRAFRNKIEFFAKFLESTFSSGLEYSVDIDKQLFELEPHDYVVCRKNGIGYIFGSGGSAGLWGHMMENTEVEGVQTQCQGNGKEHCSFICAPQRVLEEKNLEFMEAEVLEKDIGASTDYRTYNEVRETSYAENSLQDFLDIGEFDYSEGKITRHDKRYILHESSLIYLLSMNLPEEILFEPAFEYGQKVAEQESDKNMEKFITEYLSACGWGDTYIKENDDGFEVQGHLFPWTKFYEYTSFPIYRGLVSGLLTGYSDRKVELTEVEKDMKGEGFTVIVSE